MLVKKTSKNKITIPRKIVDRIGEVKYFEVELEDGVIMMRPLRNYDTDLAKIRSKIDKLGLDPQSVAEAVKWVRSKPSR
jgi:hypothetical protein